MGVVVKKMPNTVENIKQKILQLKGKEVNLHINRGRRKVSSYRARIEDVYASVFTVKSCSLVLGSVESAKSTLGSIFTYSYNDILCGEVKISND